MGVRVIWWADVVHFVDVSTLVATLDRTVSGNLYTLISGGRTNMMAMCAYSQPSDNMVAGWEPSASAVLFVSKGIDHDRVFHGAWKLVKAVFLLRVVNSSPLRDASSGLMSKTSIPCIFPRISKRSRPVACSRSVGTVPGRAPGGRRSASVLISTMQSAPFSSAHVTRGIAHHRSS